MILLYVMHSDAFPLQALSSSEGHQNLSFSTEESNSCMRVISLKL